MLNNGIPANLTYLQKALLLGQISPDMEVVKVTGEANMFTTGIDITVPGLRYGSPTWHSQIECHGSSADEANEIRCFVMEAIQEKASRMNMAEWHATPWIKTYESDPSDE